jgi:hypothetical protein
LRWTIDSATVASITTAAIERIRRMRSDIGLRS